MTEKETRWDKEKNVFLKRYSIYSSSPGYLKIWLKNGFKEFWLSPQEIKEKWVSTKLAKSKKKKKKITK